MCRFFSCLARARKCSRGDVNPPKKKKGTIPARGWRQGIFAVAQIAASQKSCNHGSLHRQSHWSFPAPPTTVHTLDKRAGPQLRFGHPADARRPLVVHILYTSVTRLAMCASNVPLPGYTAHSRASRTPGASTWQSVCRTSQSLHLARSTRTYVASAYPCSRSQSYSSRLMASRL